MAPIEERGILTMFSGGSKWFKRMRHSQPKKTPNAVDHLDHLSTGSPWGRTPGQCGINFQAWCLSVSYSLRILPLQQHHWPSPSTTAVRADGACLQDQRLLAHQVTSVASFTTPPVWYSCIHQYRVAAADKDVCHASSWRVLTTTLCLAARFCASF